MCDLLYFLSIFAYYCCCRSPVSAKQKCEMFQNSLNTASEFTGITVLQSDTNVSPPAISKLMDNIATSSSSVLTSVINSAADVPWTTRKSESLKRKNEMNNDFDYDAEF